MFEGKRSLCEQDSAAYWKELREGERGDFSPDKHWEQLQSWHGRQTFMLILTQNR